MKSGQTGVFISYRRADSAGYAGRLAEGLRERFGDTSVFQDVETIPPGSDFAREIDAAIGRCQVLLVLIGDTWVTERGADGRRRLDDPEDFVRLEVATALRRGVRVLPVLIEGARMAAARDLPADVRPLARLQALELSDSRWDYDFGRLAEALENLAPQVGFARPRRRRPVFIVTGALLSLAGIGITFYLLRPADVSGRWDLPNGSYWILAQDGQNLEIQEVHYESREVWRRGTGRIRGDRVEFELELVFRGLYRYRGDLALEPDGRTLRGTLETMPIGRREPLVLVRN